MDPAQRQPREQPLGPPLIGTLLRRPAEALRGRLLDELHAAGFSDLVEAHLAVLRYPGPHGRRPSDLAADTGMTRQALNYLLGQLQKAGYLTRRGDGDDQRSRRICLTTRGHAALLAIQDAMTRTEAELEHELGPAQMTQLRTLLITLNTTQAVRQAHPPATRRPAV
jgi:DNA-binding MarR family transcriptional regulator